MMRERNIPLYALESKAPIKDFDVLGFTMPYEMCYTNILNMIDLSGIPVLSKDRTDEDPIVVSGGPCVYNAEPMTDFIDVFFIGESEEAIQEMVEVIKNGKQKINPAEDGKPFIDWLKSRDAMFLLCMKLLTTKMAYSEP